VSQPADATDAEPIEAGVALWGSQAWRQTAIAWLDARLAERGLERAGSVEQPHLRPWATALRVPTHAGVFWLKAAAPGTAFEIRLYPVLARLAPERVLAPLAIDEARSWIILPDGGATLGASASGERLVDGLCRAMADYARLQQSLAPHADELLRLGVTDMRAALMPQRFDEAAAKLRERLDRAGSDEERASFERASALRGAFIEQCRALEQSAIAPSLDHNDLHPWNIFADAEGRGSRFYDWGDSVVAHPFASLLVALGFMRYQLKAAADDARILRVRDAYLAEYASVASHAELVREAELACRVAKIARVLTWSRALEALEGDEAGELAGAPLRWFAALLDPSPVAIGG